MDRSMLLEGSPGRKLQRPRRQSQRVPSLAYPDRLRPGPDKDEDVASAFGVQAHMNQSMFSLIAAAGSKTDLYPRFGEESSGSDAEREEEGRQSVRKRDGRTMTENEAKTLAKREKARQDRADLGSGTPVGLDNINVPQQTKRAQLAKGEEVGEEEDERFNSRQQKPESKLLQSLPRLRIKSHREKHYMSQSMILPEKASGAVTPSPGPVTPRDAPVMQRIIEAEASIERRLDSERSKSQAVQPSLENEGRRTMDSRPKLMAKLKEIFGFDELEEVIAEYPCWLLQSVLLQGYLYITAKHFCFYAYLPKKSNQVLKSGSMMKKVKRGPKYNRQWFVLKGDILSYYDDPSSTYFQVGYVDLRFATSASLSESKENPKDTRDFTVTTPNRIYYFRADSSTSAKEWVKMLQKVIFRTHNDGDSVKIALPISNVIDIEESPVIEVAKTVLITVFENVFENEEALAVDEYFFSFFSFGQDAISVMQSMVADKSSKRLSEGQSIENSSSKPQRPSVQVAENSNAGSSQGSHSAASPLMFLEKGKSGSSSSRYARVRPASFDLRQNMRQSQESDDPDYTLQRENKDQSHRADSKSPATNAERSQREWYGEFSPIMKASHRSESFADSIMSDDFQSSGSQVLSRSDIFKAKGSQLPHSPEQSEDEASGISGARTMGKPNRTDHDSRSATPRLPEQSEQDIASSLLEADASSPGLKKLIKAGQYPLQSAGRLATMIHRSSKDVIPLLATKSMGYVEKVSGMWVGGGRRYRRDLDGPSDQEEDSEANAQDHEEASGRFRSHFGLPDSETLLATYFVFLHRVLPLYGKIYISDRYFCFRSLLPGTKTKIILPLHDVETVHKEKGFRLRYSGLVVVIQGYEELFFEFATKEGRDDCAVFLHRCLDSMKIVSESMHSSTEEEHVRLARAEHHSLMEARNDGRTVQELDSSRLEESTDMNNMPTVNFDDPRASILNFKPTESLRITCLTIGSRGDVQPYIALCKGLLSEGHKTKIASHAEFGPWIRSHGIAFEPIDGDPAELMRICVENGMFTVSFLREASSKFRGWIDDLLSSAWKACQDSDVLIESPSTMAGIHIAEALKIPYFRAFTMPWTRTRAYPHAFAVPEHRMGGAYNWLTYVMFDNVFWAAISGQVNRWRKKELKLPSTTLEKLHPNKVPFLYNFSPSVVIPPIDFSDWVRVTGYWFLDEGQDYVPDKVLSNFIKQARRDGKKIAYIGFGSIVVSNPKALTQSVVEAVLKADVRCILSKGWSDRLGSEDNTKAEVPLPSEILQIKSCPHDWLFKQVDCAVHHGGAGTTGASLRAGLPTIIKPFFGDQFFFGNRIEDLQVGIYLKKLNVSVLSRALWEATHSERMITKARLLGEKIRKEDGVGTAIQAIYRDLEYAKSLIKHHTAGPTAGNAGTGGIEDFDNEIGDEESWTFVDDESDPEFNQRIAHFNSLRQKTEIENDLGQPDAFDRMIEQLRIDDEAGIGHFDTREKSPRQNSDSKRAEKAHRREKKPTRPESAKKDKA